MCPGSCTYNFQLHPISYYRVTWPHLVAGAGICCLYFAQLNLESYIIVGKRENGDIEAVHGN